VHESKYQKFTIMKKMIKSISTSAIIALLIVFVFSACENNETTVSEQVLEETAFAENVFAQLATDVEDAVPYDQLNSGRFGFIGFGFGFGNCMTRTVETPEDGDFPKIITIEYDGECSSGNFNTVKSGKIIITLTGPPSEEGSQRIVTFENFTINGNVIEGTKTITFNGGYAFSCVLTNGKITTPEGDVIIRESTHTRTLVAGGDTPERSDDVYEITGYAEGETSGGLYYKKEIIEPLVVSKECFWISKGIVETTVGDIVWTINFGDGTCDNIATKTQDGVDEEFTMEMKVRKMWRHRHQHHKR
jgi:hypothetical protein